MLSNYNALSLTDSELEHLKKILAYLREDEEKHYEEYKENCWCVGECKCSVSKHIFTSVLAVESALEESCL